MRSQLSPKSKTRLFGGLESQFLRVGKSYQLG